MKTPDTPTDEPHRLQALRALGLLDSAPEAAFDDIVRIGRALFSVPTCLVSLIDSDRQWFKAAAGLDATETPRRTAICVTVVQKGKQKCSARGRHGQAPLDLVQR